jgi:hypothetical protein
MKAEDGTLTWDLWIDFQAEDADGLTPALVEHARPGVSLDAGTYVLVGNEHSDLAVARVVSVESDGLVYARVLAGPASEHLHLVGG